PAKLLRAVVARAARAEGVPSTHTPSPRVDLVSCFPDAVEVEGEETGTGPERRHWLPQLPVPRLRPLFQEQPKRREARRGAEGGGALPHRLPPAPQPGRRPQAPSLSRLTGI